MTKNESSGMIDLESKFWRTSLLIIAVFLVFAGPTYVPYALADVLHVNYVASILAGAVLLIIGLLLLWFLIRKKVIL
jgi:hypothetical protein